MPDIPHTFSERAAQRVVAAVRRIEETPRQANTKRPRWPIATAEDFVFKWGKTQAAATAGGAVDVKLWTGTPFLTIGDYREQETDEVVECYAVGVALDDYHRVELHPLTGMETGKLQAWPMECEAEARP